MTTLFVSFLNITTLTYDLNNIIDDCWVSKIIDPEIYVPQPQSLATQIIGYCCTALVIGHGLPSVVDIYTKKVPDLVPDGSLIARTILSVLMLFYGVMACQLPYFVGGLGSLLFFVLMAIAKCLYRNQCPCINQCPCTNESCQPSNNKAKDRTNQQENENIV